jgi:subtilisin family serine protease
VQENDDTGNELEVWYTGGPLAVFVKPPTGARKGPVTLGQPFQDFDFGGFICRVSHTHDVTNGANHINIFLDFPPIAGAWTVLLKNVGGGPARFDAWIERDDGVATQSRFVRDDASPVRTLGSLSCGVRPIVVGAYPTDAAAPAVSDFSSAGGTRDGRSKPDVCAPGEDGPGVGIRAAEATTNGQTRWSGTSQAAPHVTGVVALMMQAAGRPLTIAEIREALLASARPAASAWDARAGFGRVDAVGAISKVLNP